MKLATYKDGSRDGQLVVVSRDLGQACFATGTATRLQQVLDDWNFMSPQLQDLYVALNQGKARHAFAFDTRQCMAPLPRAHQWVEGLAYLNHRDLLHPAGSAPLPDKLRGEPLLGQRGSDDFLGPCDEAWFGSEAWGIDFSAELAVITGDVEMGASPGEALDGVRLLLLANGWTLREFVPAEQARCSGGVQSRPTTAFSPVAVTPDELGEAWRGGRLHLTLQSSWNGKKVGLSEAGPEMSFHFGQLIATLAKTRKLRAGSLVGSGTVSHKDPARGYHCIAEKRALETRAQGEPRTGYLVTGDSIRIEMKGRDGLSVFGAIDQRVSAPADPSAPAAGPADAPAASDGADHIRP